MEMLVSKKERIIWIVLFTAILVIFLLAISSYQSNLTVANKRIRDLEEAKKAWARTETNLTTEISDLKSHLAKKVEYINTLPNMDPTIGLILERRGFKGGQQLIVDDLVKHNELIPFKGVLGGTMAFYKEKVFVISDKWVIAYFEDGHMNGNMLLSYSVINGNITWKVIDSYLIGQ